MSSEDKNNERYYADFWDAIINEKGRKISYIIDDKEYTDIEAGSVLKLLEDKNYMSDYIPDKDGNIIRVRFDSINQKNEKQPSDRRTKPIK